jgi:hypothetical protein
MTAVTPILHVTVWRDVTDCGPPITGINPGQLEPLTVAL